MYTCLDNDCINIDTDVTYISDVNSFIEDIMLGCIEPDTVIVSDKNDETSKLLESVGCKVITPADIINCEDSAVDDSNEPCLSNEESNDLVNCTQEETQEEIIEEEIMKEEPQEAVEEETVEEETVEEIQEETVVEETVGEAVEETVEEIVEEDTVKEEVIEEEIIEESTVEESVEEEVVKDDSQTEVIYKVYSDVTEGVEDSLNNSIVSDETDIKSTTNTVETKSKTKESAFKRFTSNVISKIPFLNKKKQEIVFVTTNNSIAKSLTDSSNDLTNITVFKKWLIKENYLDEEQVKLIESEVSLRKGRGHNVKFLMTARELGLLNEVDCSRILTSATKREVRCYADIDIDKVKTITAYNSFTRKDCFLINHNIDSRCVEVGYDIGTQCDLGFVEVYFPGYKIICKEFVEGTTNKVVCDIAV